MCLTFILLPLSSMAAEPTQKIIMSYWWYNDDNVSTTQTQGSPLIYPLPGSYDVQGHVQDNKDFSSKLNDLDVIAYAFFPVNKKGEIHFEDSYVDLGTDDKPFCEQNKGICKAGSNNDNVKLDNFHAFSHLQNKSNSLKKIISIGGGADQASFEHAIAHPAAFLNSVQTLVNHYHLSGVDLDFEVSDTFSPTQAKQYTQLIEKLRAKLGNKAWISMTTAFDQGAIHSIGAKNWETIAKNVNIVSDMCYDFHTPFAKLHYTGFMSNLFPNNQEPNTKGYYHANCDESIQYLNTQGVPTNKIIMGVPFYAFSYGSVPAKNNGLFQPFDPSKKPKLAPNTKPGILSYQRVQELLSAGFKEHVTYHDNKANAVWAYNPKTKQMVVYDNQQTIATKADYINENHLGGAMIWALNFDVSPDNSNSLLTTLKTKLKMEINSDFSEQTKKISVELEQDEMRSALTLIFYGEQIVNTINAINSFFGSI